MKNGYYLSAYLEVDSIGNLCLMAHRHDQCIGLWKYEDKKVTLVHYWELERITGRKQHSLAFFSVEQFKAVMNSLLAIYGITMDDIIEVWGTPHLGELENYISISRYPDITYHTICHLASCMFMDMDVYKNENILAFSVDGGSDIVADTYAYKRFPFAGCYHVPGQNDIHLFPVYSPGLIWSYMKSKCGLREGSLMALASASKSESYETFEDALTKTNVKVADGFYERLDKIYSTILSYTKEDEGVKFNYFDSRFSEKDNKISMAMKIIQDMSYRIMELNIDEAIKTYGINPEDTYLAVSGGFALNCPCNTCLMEKYKFKGFVAPPCVSDSGMAMGIGLYSFFDKTNGDFEFHFENAYYGDADDEKAFFARDEYAHYIESTSPFDPKQVVEDMQIEPVVWFEGRAEVGPRALGARSLIGDPRQQKIKDRLNEIKLRQWWRPVAPIVLADQIGEWFEDDYESPYMLHAVRIKEEKRELIPAIMHEDFTARLQSIKKEDGLEKLYEVITCFYKETGVPIICNTSLNDKGEPIIDTIEEAFNFALRKGIRVGYFNGVRVVFKNHSDYTETAPQKRQLRIQNWKNEEEWEEYFTKYNPCKADNQTLFYYVYMKVDNEELLQDKQEVKRLKVRSGMFLDTFSKEKRMRLKKHFAEYDIRKHIME